MKTLWKTVFSSAFQKSYICETVGEKRICYNVRSKAGVCMDVKLRSYTDLRKGLTAEEAAARREKGEYNEQLKKTTKSYRMIFRDNLMTLFNLINVILAALVFITGNYRNMLFLGVIISNIVIGIFQEIRSKRVLDRLSLLSQTHVKALRDGRECELALDEIVMDDLLFLSNGDQIPCDAIVREGRLECNESLVSGESDIILKEAGSFLYSGSFAVSGHVCAQVCAVGRQTYVHTILDHARQVRRHPSQLRDAINFIIKTVSIIIVPMGLVVFFAFTDKSGAFTLDNILRVGQYSNVFLRSIWLGAIATAISLLLGYPLAYTISKMKAKRQSVMIMLVMLPMWMNFLLRTYAWMSLLEDNGLINNMLAAIGLPRVHMINTAGAVVLGMVYNYIPYMILPIYSVLTKIDNSVIEAAQDLGANDRKVFLKVVLPMSMPGVISGITMVFVPAVSTFIISKMLGGGGNLLIGDLIDMQFLGSAYNPNLGSAISLVLMVIILICMGIMNQFDDGDENMGGGMIL